MAKGGRQNLIKAEDLTSDQLRERARKGGLASVAKKRERKKFRELLEIALDMKSSGDMTHAENIVASMIQAAEEGDVKAFIAIRDTVGEKPEDKVQVGLADNLFDDVLGVKDV